MPSNDAEFVESQPGQREIADLTSNIHAAYRDHTPESARWFDRASQALVAGVSGTVRYFDPYPTYFADGLASRAVDLDGNSYVDSFLCGACLLLGHRRPEIMAAIATNTGRGSLLLNPKLSTEVAEQMQAMLPAAERVRLVNSGTEAVMNVLRIARAFTGRSKIVKFAGTYHGMEDQMLVGLDSRGIRLGHGIPASAVAETVHVPFGDLAALAQALKGNEIAAVLIDPSMHHGGIWSGTSDLYREMADMARSSGALVIFDEVISGFRLAAGGAQEYFSFVPDLAVYGKALAVGEKLGAIVGRADVMAVLDPSASRRTGPFSFQSGTGSDSLNGLTAALAAMKVYEQLGKQDAYVSLSALADRLGRGIRDAFAARGLACEYRQLGPIVRLFLTNGPMTYEHCSRLPHAPINLFHLAMLTEGVLTIPGSNDFFLSFAHTSEDIEAIVAAANRVLDRFDFGGVVAPRSERPNSTSQGAS